MSDEDFCLFLFYLSSANSKYGFGSTLNIRSPGILITIPIDGPKKSLLALIIVEIYENNRRQKVKY